MKIVHIESGLGNQMLSYCEYISLKKVNPSDDLYLETVIYDIPECNEVTCQWNGYELGKIFGIQTPNIRSIISDEKWLQFMEEVKQSEFWKKNMNYPVYFTRAFSNIGIEVINTWGNFEESQFIGDRADSTGLKQLKYRIKKSYPYLWLRMWKLRQPIELSKLNCQDELFPQTTENLFTGQKLKFKFKGSGIERIEKEIRDTFKFPPICDAKNSEAFDYISSCNSVAIHARRGDLLGSNYGCYATGYFRRAVKYIRKHTENPIFFIFCDPGSVSWAKDNSSVLGLNFKKDEIHFVDWNKSSDSYRDMQLMANCKHHIITNSSFGWWGAWLNTNPNKITISPDFRINTTHTL